MSFNNQTAIDKILTRIRSLATTDYSENDIIRTSLRKSIAEGMEEALASVKAKSKEIAYQVLGVNTKWSAWSLDGGELKQALTVAMKPDVEELAKEIIKHAKLDNYTTLTATRKKQLARGLKGLYDTAVNDAVYTHFKAQITAQAKADVAELWNHMPVLLGNENTLEDVVAEHFTAMIAQDADLNNQNRKNHHIHVQRFMEDYENYKQSIS